MNSSIRKKKNMTFQKESKDSYSQLKTIAKFRWKQCEKMSFECDVMLGGGGGHRSRHSKLLRMDRAVHFILVLCGCITFFVPHIRKRSEVLPCVRVCVTDPAFLFSTLIHISLLHNNNIF